MDPIYSNFLHNLTSVVCSLIGMESLIYGDLNSIDDSLLDKRHSIHADCNRWLVADWSNLTRSAFNLVKLKVLHQRASDDDKLRNLRQHNLFKFHQNALSFRCSLTKTFLANIFRFWDHSECWKSENVEGRGCCFRIRCKLYVNIVHGKHFPLQVLTNFRCCNVVCLRSTIWTTNYEEESEILERQKHFNVN